MCTLHLPDRPDRCLRRFEGSSKGPLPSIEYMCCTLMVKFCCCTQVLPRVLAEAAHGACLELRGKGCNLRAGSSLLRPRFFPSLGRAEDTSADGGSGMKSAAVLSEGKNSIYSPCVTQDLTKR